MKENKFNYTIEEKIENLKRIDEEITKIRKEREEIQNKFSFLIPVYILDEINLHKADKNYETVFNMIGLAIKAKTLSKENGEILRNSIDKQF